MASSAPLPSLPLAKNSADMLPSTAQPSPVVGQRISIRWRGGVWFDGTIAAVTMMAGTRASRHEVSVTVNYDDGDTFTHDLRKGKYELGSAPQSSPDPDPKTCINTGPDPARKRQKVELGQSSATPLRQHPRTSPRLTPLALQSSPTAGLVTRRPPRPFAIPRRRLLSLAFVWVRHRSARTQDVGETWAQSSHTSARGSIPRLWTARGD